MPEINGDAHTSQRAAYYASLPAPVRYDKHMSPMEKLIYAEITAMSDYTRFCWASNAYLADQFKVSVRTIQRVLHKLADRGLVTLEIVKGEKGNIIERRVWLGSVDLQAGKIAHGGSDKNVMRGGDKNVMDIKENNLNIYIPPIVPQIPHVKSPRRELRETAEWLPERFEKLWKSYEPHARRGNRQRAIQAWDRLHPSEELCNHMAACFSRQMRSQEWQEGYGIPHVSTWLNNAGWEGWEDAAEEPRQKKSAANDERRDLQWL